MAVAHQPPHELDAANRLEGTINSLEDLKLSLNKGIRKIPTVVDMHCPVCNERTLGVLIGLSHGRGNLFSVNYNCPVCDDTCSVPVLGSYQEYSIGG